MNEKAKKGIFITTSYFTDDAKQYVDRVNVKIVLIDGLKLAGMMVDNNLDVVVQQRYEVKKLDEDFFEGS